MEDDDTWRLALQKKKCPHGCDLSLDTCQHLDNYLAAGRVNGPPLVFEGNEEALRVFSAGSMPTEQMLESIWPQASNMTVDEIEAELKRFGLAEHEVLVLVERFCHSLSYPAIAQMHGFVHPMIVWRIQKKAIAKLKNMQFKFGETYEDLL